MLNDVEELEHHGADAAEEPRPKLALEQVGEHWRWIDVIALRFRIHLALVRSEQHVDRLAVELLAVFGEGPRIGVEIVGRGELEAVDEDRRHHARCTPPREPHQG